MAKRISSHRLGLLILLAIGLPRSNAASAREADPCQDVLEAARKAYAVARFEQTVRLLKEEKGDCLQDQRLDKADRVRAYRLLALSHLELSAEDEPIRALVGQILDIQSHYQPEPGDNQRFAALIKAEGQQRLAHQRRKWWLWGGAAALLGGAGAYVLLQDPKDLPGPPAFPSLETADGP